MKRSERNPIVTEMLGGTLKGRTHELLHVHYQKKGK
ncbi:iron hydrogenase small subunit [uncultured Dysosmobacter sp.]|nr:iron hydrogenase small subunit [uncultured Dysosmobacter sp.]